MRGADERLGRPPTGLPGRPLVPRGAPWRWLTSAQRLPRPQVSPGPERLPISRGVEGPTSVALTVAAPQVERVLHPLLQRQYELHRDRLEQCCERRPAEQVLYHGTAGATVPDICAHGFNRSFCGRNGEARDPAGRGLCRAGAPDPSRPAAGTLYGQGVYFAKRASLSVQDRYSPPDAEGHKAVFVARVLTGDYAQGCRGLRAPPLRAPGHVPLRYDSAVDSLRQPSIFVIFHDTQALPTHLITCRHTAGPPPAGLPGDWTRA